MPNPWDAPPPPDKGDATQEPIFTAIGRCLTTWEYIEHDLAEMFSVFVGATDAFGDEPAMKSYGTIISHRNRMEMVAAAADSYFRINRNDKLKDDFKELAKKCSGWVVDGMTLRTASLSEGNPIPISSCIPVYTIPKNGANTPNTPTHRLKLTSSLEP